MEFLWTLEFVLAEAGRATRRVTRCLEGLLHQAAPGLGQLWPGDDDGDEVDNHDTGEDEIGYPVRRRRRGRRRRR